jgi:N-hydroxyarylamine O-acetyltransferase
MDVQSYLDRLGVTITGGPSIDQLRLLHESHLFEVPFENLDIYHRVEIVLDQDRILEKIIERRRGGFCYELNSSFAWLLRKLGYSVALLSGEVARKEGGFGIPFDHMTLEVVLEESWIADVGFGDSPRYPLRLVPDKEAEQFDERYRFRVDGSWWILERRYRREDDFKPLYRFTREPRQLSDFIPGCRYHQTSTKSTFTQGVICSKALPEGRISLTKDRLVTTRNGVRTRVPICDRDEWLIALKSHFGIAL